MIIEICIFKCIIVLNTKLKKERDRLMNKQNMKGLVFGALFTALTCVFTMVIKVPTLGTNGYVNIGDTGVLLSAWLLGGGYGIIAAGLGSGLADLLSGYPVYAPGTFIVKLLMALAAYNIYKKLGSKTGSLGSAAKSAVYVVSAVVAEIIMVLGYLVYEYFVLGYGAAALPSVLSNIAQAGSNIVLSLVLITVLEKSHVWERAVQNR